MKLLITQSNYIPWKGYFDAINLVDKFVIYDEVQYTKRDWRNRNKIVTRDGLKWLTIPVQVKGKFEQKINETYVSDQSWRTKHWKTIEYNYKQAEYFDEISSLLKPLYLNSPESRLTDINFKFLNTICSYLNINTKILRSKDFDFSGDKSEKLISICKQLDAKSYFSGSAAMEYLDTKKFNDEGIEVVWLDYNNYPSYKQLFGEYNHFVSIIDLLFNCGVNAKNYMKSFINPSS